MADDTQPDIIGITETWTKPDMGDAEFGLAGYKMFRKDRLVKRGGGVMLYFKEHIQAYEIQIEAEVGFSEAIWCNLESHCRIVTPKSCTQSTISTVLVN